MEKVKLKRRQILKLHVAIIAIRGRDEPVKDENGKVLGQYTKPYEFDSIKPTYAMARTLSAIEDVVEAIEEGQRVIAVKHFRINQKETDDSKKTTNADKDSEDSKFLSGEEEVELYKFDIVELKAHTNKIPPHIQSALFPIMNVPDDYGK